MFAPKHKPVDIAPQPEYKSNNVSSSFSRKVTLDSLISSSLEASLDAFNPSSFETVDLGGVPPTETSRTLKFSYKLFIMPRVNKNLS